MTDVDVCVIGGGIQGCGVAQAAAAAGYSTILLEQHALGSATSSRSSKLIHGGLRYLESGQFALVAKSLAERERLLRNAPALVQRVPFYIPVYKHTRRRGWQIAVGLSLYALLGRLHHGTGFRRVPRREWRQLDGLNLSQLQAVYQYWDASTDDRELTRAVMYSAMQLGARCLCPARCIGLQHANGGFHIDYLQAGQHKSLRSKALVNAAGPWVAQVHSLLNPQVPFPAIELVQGAHLILQQPAPSAVYYVESRQDQRAVFIMPWKGQTMVGTTETVTDGDPADVQVTEKEIDYLKAVMCEYFPHSDLHILDEFAGERVLQKTDGSVFRRPRDTLLYTHGQLDGYVAMVGGKLTAYRMTAEEVMRYISVYLPKNTPVANTRELKLDCAPEDFTPEAASHS